RGTARAWLAVRECKAARGAKSGRKKSALGDQRGPKPLRVFLLCSSDHQIVIKHHVSTGNCEGRNHDGVAWSAVEHVLTAIADQHVVTVAAAQNVVAGASDQHVIAVAASSFQK